MSSTIPHNLRNAAASSVGPSSGENMTSISSSVPVADVLSGQIRSSTLTTTSDTRHLLGGMRKRSGFNRHGRNGRNDRRYLLHEALVHLLEFVLPSFVNRSRLLTGFGIDLVEGIDEVVHLPFAVRVALGNFQQRRDG